MIARPLPPPRYSSWQAINVAITLGLRALEEVRALAAVKAPAVEAKTVDRAEIERMIADAIAGLPQPKRGPEGPVGKFVAPKAWSRRIHYESAVVAHAGSTWCALRDTAEEPPHEDWAIVAARGADAPVGEVFGLYDANHKYRKFDLVHLDGCEWRAKCDDPGELPGAGWAMAAKMGRSPDPNKVQKMIADEVAKLPPLERGRVGPPAPTIVKWVKDGYRATPMMSDGTAGPALDVREFFELYHGEAG